MEKKGVIVSHLVEKKGTIIGPLKSQNRLIFVYQLQGKVTFEYSGEKYNMKGGDTLYFDGNYEHKVIIKTNTESILISLKQWKVAKVLKVYALNLISPIAEKWF